MRRLGAAAIAAVLVLAACQDDGPPPPTTTAPPPSTAPPTTTATPPSTAPPTTPPSPTSPPVTTAASTTTAEATTTSAPPNPTAAATAPQTSTTVPAQPTDPAAPRLPLRNADGANEAYSGIGQLRGYGSSCTAFLIDAGEPSGPAYAMTNGHCVGLFDSTTVIRDGTGGDGVVTFRLFEDTPNAHADIPVDAVLYATMRGTDVAILALGASRRELAGLVSYRLADAPPDGGAIEVAGIPTAGLAAPDRLLRGDRCTAGQIVRLVEWEWLWDAAQSSDCTGILPGSSGSPVFDAGDRVYAVGIVNTTTIGAPPGRNCGLGQPCEVATGGVGRRADRTYAMPVSVWARCFDPAWDPDASGCPIERTPIAVHAPLRAVRPGAMWAATVTAGGTGVNLAAKSGPAATTDCRDRAGYAPLAPPFLVDTPLPPQEGVVLLCAAALGSGGTPDTSQAGVAVMEVDATPPSEPIRLSKRSVEDGVLVEPVFQVPEYSDFSVKVGPPATHCDDPAGYVPYRRVPLHVARADLPARLCVIGADEAGNRGTPQGFELT